MSRKKWLSVLLVLCLMVLLAVPVSADSLTKTGIQNLSDLAGKIIAVQTGTNLDELLNEKDYLKGTLTLSYYNSPVDMVEAVKSGKVDAVPFDKPVAEIYCNLNPELMILPDQMDVNDFGIGFQKGSRLVAPFNQALAQLRQDGILEELEAKWTGADESVKIPIPQDWDAPNGTLRYWVDATYEPMCYLGNSGTLLGYEVDVVLYAARIMGYRVETNTCNFDGLIPALVSGKADLVSSGISITPERAESIDFSDGYYRSSVVMVVRRGSDSAQGVKRSIWDSVSDSFYRTFLKENRWQLFLLGIGNTLLITVMSALIGTAMGFAIYILCSAAGRQLTRCVEGFFSLLERMPIIVFLMVLYYVVFGRVDISGVLVSVLAFTMTFASAVYGMLSNGVKAISFGQTEAAYALGYNKWDAFFKIVLPQAARFITPTYRSELISLVKGTAVVGYIAVQDLTKMGDIVRSRTYEAFFPLITTAVLYVILTWLLTVLINRVEIHLDPKRRSVERILKGVVQK